MKNVFLMVLLFMPLLLFGQQGRNVTVFTIDSFTKDPGTTFNLVKNWRFHDGDSAGLGAKEIDDSKWPIVEPALMIPEKLGKDYKPFSGIGWFRLHFTIDTGLSNIALAYALTYFGASEVYLDGNKIDSSGKINGKDGSQYIDPQSLPQPLSLSVAGEHILAVKYANYNAQRNYKIFNCRNVGFEMKLGESKLMTIRDHLQTLYNTFIYILFFGIFIAVSCLHLFLYLYYRTIRTNLFFSIFCFSVALLFLAFHFMRFSPIPDLQLISSNAQAFIVPAMCLSLSGFINELYSSKKGRFRFILVYSIICPIIFVINHTAGVFAIISLGFAVLVQVIIRTIWAIVNKVKGSRILGTGVLFFTLFVFFCLVFALSTGSINFSDDTTIGLILLVILVLAILSLPVSISLFLAWNFASVNKDLKKRLDEVHELSDKNLEQEQEKKRILENQKEELEHEVAVRTTEVVAQKDKIEKQHHELLIEKNKSELLLKDLQVKNQAITDNITYAKRIQSAILPDINLIYKTLEDSFVLYLPKDIVSGDFYAFAEKHGKVLIISGDCTGHGVSGALMSMIGSSLLNQIIIEKGIEQPAMILTQLNTAVIDTFRQGENESNDGMDVSICSFDLNSYQLQFAGANRPLWLVRGNEVEVIKPDKFPIGGLQSARDRNFTNNAIQLQKGDIVYIFTDGYADQFGGENGKKLMSTRFKELLLSIRQMEMKAQEKYLLHYFEQWKGDMEQVDDVLVIGIRV